MAVTGIGAVSPGGVGVEALWDLVARADDGPVVRGVPGWDPARWLERRERRRSDDYVTYALAAMTEADEAAGSPRPDARRRGVIVGNVFGPSTALADAALRRRDDPDWVVPPALGLLASTSSCAAHLAQVLGATGPVEVVSAACAAGTYALAHGAELVASGEADAVWAGGTEGEVADLLVEAYANLRTLSPGRRVRPFDRRRDGFAFGEGAAVLVLEPLDAARARGARVWGELAGWGSSNDAGHGVRPSGAGAVAAMRQALERAGIDAADVRHVNAHGTGTLIGDTTEAAALNEVFGPGAVPVTSTKRVTGHGVAAAGAWEAAVALLSMDRGALPPSGIDHEADPALDLDVVTGAPRPWEPGPVVSNSFGIGGINGSLVLLPPEG